MVDIRTILVVVAVVATVNAGSLRIKRASAATQVDVLDVRTQVRTRFATTVIKSVLKNTGNKAEEAQFSVVLPEDAFISNFSMLIDGKLIVGDVKEKEEAKRAYDQAVSLGQSAGHVLQNTRETNRFDTSVNVAKGSSVSFELTYDEVLQRVHGVYKQVFNIQAPAIVPTLRIHTTIIETRKITHVSVPDIGDRVGEKTNKQLKLLSNDKLVKIEQVDTKDGSIVNVLYTPSVRDQRGLEVDNGDGIRAQMTVLYDVERTEDAGELVVADGYFVHFFAPQTRSITPKRVVFVIDISGSMSGTKMSQTIDAMVIILNDLNADDIFNIVIFDDQAFVWNAGFKVHSGSKTELKDAIDYVRSLKADGGTNLHDSILKAISLFDKAASNKVDMIIFLTDGQATSGVTDSEAILRDVKKALEEKKLTIHTIAFGSGADYELLRKVASLGHGIGKKIYEDSDAALQMEGFYAQVGNPVMTNVDIKYLNVSLEPNSVQQDVSYNYYEGGEIVVVGKLASVEDTSKNIFSNDNAATTSVMTAVVEADTGTGRRVLRCMPPPCYQIMCLRFPCRPAPWCPPFPTPAPRTLNPRSYDGYLQRMWAYRTIKKIINDLETSDLSATEKKATEKEALDLSLKYNFVTKFTSMVVVQDGKVGELGATEDRQSYGGRGAGGGHMLASFAAASGFGARPSLRGPAGAPGPLGGASFGRPPPAAPPLSAPRPGFPSIIREETKEEDELINYPVSSFKCANGGRAQVTNTSTSTTPVECPCSYLYSCERLANDQDKYACCSVNDEYDVRVCPTPNTVWSFCAAEECHPTCDFIKGGGKYNKYACSTECNGSEVGACRCAPGYAMNDKQTCVKLERC